MENKKKYRVDEESLERYNEMKPAAKWALGITARIGVKMIKTMVRVAWYLPGLIKRAFISGHPDHKDQRGHPSGPRQK